MPANDLKERLESAGGGLPIPDPPIEDLLRRGRRRVARRRIGTVVSTALIVVALAWTIQGLAGLGTATHPATSPTPNPASPPAGSLIKTTRVGYRPLAMSASSGTLWVTNTGDGTITRIDPASGAVVATIHVPIDGGNYNTTTIGTVRLRSSLGATPVWSLGDHTWVPAGGMTFDIDADTNQLQSGSPPIHGVPEVSSMVTGGGVTWVCCLSHGTPTTHGVERVDPTTMRATVGAAVPDTGLPTAGVDQTIAADREGALWAGAGNHVYRFDPNTGEQTDSVQIGPGPSTENGTTHTGAVVTNMVFADGTLWVCCDDSFRLLRIDAETRRVVGRPLPVPEAVDVNPGLLAAGGGYVWAMNCCVGPQFTTDVYRLDPGTLRWTGPVPFQGEDPWGLTAFRGSLWLLQSRSGENGNGRGLLYRIALSDFERAVRPNPAPAAGTDVAFATGVGIVILLGLALLIGLGSRRPRVDGTRRNRDLTPG